jgi:protease stability complex PrcB-like protein
MVRTGTIALLLVLAVGCAAGNGSEPSGDDSNETAEVPETLRVVQISSEAPGQGPRRPRVILSPSAAGLERETGASVPSDAGRGTYLAAYWGEKPTGGYSLGVRSSRLEGDRVTVRLALEEPPPDAIVTQALTYPHAMAVVRGLDPEGKNFLFVDQRGRRLDWPVRRVGG